MNALSSRELAGDDEPSRRLFIALAGNPNAGKTSLFNCLTGAAQQVSNYPGVTVECKEGKLRRATRRISVVDLPGTYSLTAYSQEERVARDYIVAEQPTLVVDVVDASNLERNLYLTVQIMEMQAPMVIALNMIDAAEKRGLAVDVRQLSLLLGVPVVATVGRTGRGIDELITICEEVLDGKRNAVPAPVAYGHVLDEEITRLAEVIAANALLEQRENSSWLAVKLLEKDAEIHKRLRRVAGARWPAVETAMCEATSRIERHYDEDAATMIAERRYGVAAGLVRQCVSRTASSRRDITDKIDNVVCHRLLGPAILVGVVAALFFWVFKLSDEWQWIPWIGGWTSPTGLINEGIGAVSNIITPVQDQMPMLHSLIDAAFVRGVGGVLGFVPLIFFMFLFISALEDSGYIARVAFILDRLLRLFGMQGKSILAMIVSGGLGAGGCAVPGIMATRTLREEKDRLVTMLVAPFMNCGAKMPVYAMLIAAFFPARRTQMMLLLWALSWLVALVSAWMLRKFVIRGEQTPFVMELPPYHVPLLRGVFQHTWERTWLYIKKAGTIILAVNIVLWAFMYFPRPPVRLDGTQPTAAEALSYSMAGKFGHALEPISELAGFDWRTNVALIGGFAAKEVVIGSLGTVYAMDMENQKDSAPLATRLAADPAWSPLRAFALMLFVMLYAPCMTTIAVIRRESGSWKWAAFATLYSTSIALVIAGGVFQAGKLLGL